jgi:hypothetical protein
VTRRRASASLGHRQPDAAGGGMKQPEQSEPRRGPGGGRSPEYVIVVSASDWVKERYPEARANLWDALHAGQDPDHAPEPDMEAEP